MKRREGEGWKGERGRDGKERGGGMERREGEGWKGNGRVMEGEGERGQQNGLTK